MKVLKKLLIVVMLVFLAASVVACNDKTKDPDTPGGGDKTNELKPSDITKLADLANYGSRSSYYEKTPVSFDANAKTYAGASCTTQIDKLKTRIDQKNADVTNGDSTSSFVKIFAMSTPEGILDAMAQAALSFDEMNRVVEYLYGSQENPNLGQYLEEEGDTWTGIFSDGTTKWLDKKNADNTASFNAGWSFFDDWDMYDRLKNYAEDVSESAKKDLAGDNAAWQYRSILAKIYEEVKLDGDAAARTATYMLEYAVEIVETRAGGSADEAITISGGNTTFNAFAEYCKKAPSASDPFSGLQDYETLSYLLAFNEYRKAADGLKNCVILYGYYYDYNKTYYFESLKDEATYAKQLKYEKQNIFTETEWLDYVAIQRNNYVKAYRYSEACYKLFYDAHFGFQGIIEEYDQKVYEINKVTGDIGATAPGTTYTTEMKSAIAKSGSINGLAGQLALSDWIWCYSGSNDNMKAYNAANTKYEEGKDSGSSEQEYEGKFDFEMQQLYLVKYLLSEMNDAELASALYYNVYAYSASMVNNMTEDIKKIVYIRDEVKDGSDYTTISAEATDNEDRYAREKIKVIYDQTYDAWKTAGVSTLASNASSQNWTKMNSEIQTAIDYKYADMPVKSKNTQWKERTERLEDLVIARVWSCCQQNVSEADDSKCSHVENKDGTIATKDYATDHTISQFVSKYEVVLMHIGGQSEVSFQVASKGYQTHEGTALVNPKTWNAGYNGTIADLRANKTETTTSMSWGEKIAITVSSGARFVDEMEDNEDRGWWTENKTNSPDAKFDSEKHSETYSGSNIDFTYSYEFKGWYLDKDCRYEFDENDDIGVNLTVYAGYNVTKARG